ncbi:lysylphosphatidylglycerol synthase transmembrane domain-containing protein [uncultured Methanobacterium sp.]|uniref:lysylphosphatidylglycerol synthase transmembrane domain-containing protein n=1 Tax=uncultured Methanobacterium sp. TaxID=176306 RepID=UPI002AA8A737|nr:lysylphosphatidylglycerol synthase transmembrane domain-containing protein [uncultured Methanobacterium sp.]
MEKNKFWMILLFAVAVYLVMIIYANLGDLLSALAKFNWVFIPVMIILVTIAYFIRFIKWNLFLKNVDVHLPLKENLFVFFSGLSMTITPAKAGEIWKGWLIKDINGEKLSKTVPVVIVDRLTDLLGLIILSLSGIIYYKSGIYILLILVILFACFIVAIKSERISNRLISILEKRASKYSQDIKQMHKSFKKSMEVKYLIGMSAISVLAWFMECLALFFVIYGFGESLGIVLSTFIYSFASLAGAVSMIPGGLGVAEATLSGMLVFFGLSSSVAIGIALIIRLGTLWYGAILGFVVYILGKSRVMGK